MKDFDFEELDRAVSDVLGGGQVNSSATTLPTPTSIPPATRAQDIAAPTQPALVTSPSADIQNSATSTTPASTAASTTPAARRTSGRFMDMVHPSSDMRSQNGSSVEPIATPAAVTPSNTSSFEGLDASTDSPAPAPLESPFLSDAKVDKRPLGGSEPTGNNFGGFEEKSASVEQPEAAQKSESNEFNTMPDPIDFASQSIEDSAESSVNNDQSGATPEAEPIDLAAALQEELPNELRNFSDTPAEKPIKSTEESIDETLPLGELGSEDEVASDIASLEHETPEPVKYSPVSVETKAETINKEPVEELAGPVSITQQYKVQSSASLQESGAIYDTESYHRPLSTPIKKKSGIWIVVWIISLLLVGGAAGAAIYLYVLPML